VVPGEVFLVQNVARHLATSLVARHVDQVTASVLVAVGHALSLTVQEAAALEPALVQGSEMCLGTL